MNDAPTAVIKNRTKASVAKRGSAAVLEADNGADLYARIANGEKVTAIATAYGIDRDTVYAWIKRGGDERAALWAEAKRRSADALVEQAEEILDDPTATTSSAHATMAKERAAFRRWLASCRNGEYASPGAQQVNLNVDLGALHLQALVAHGSLQRAQTGLVLDAEIIADDAHHSV